MADRYVNYDKLLEERHRLGLDESSKIHKVNAFNRFIDHLPTADVVKVVRCKNCEFRGTDDCSNSYYLECEGAYVDPMEDDDFCSYGTPKERGGEK